MFPTDAQQSVNLVFGWYFGMENVLFVQIYLKYYFIIHYLFNYCAIIYKLFVYLYRNRWLLQN